MFVRTEIRIQVTHCIKSFLLKWSLVLLNEKLHKFLIGYSGQPFAKDIFHSIIYKFRKEDSVNKFKR